MGERLSEEEIKAIRKQCEHIVDFGSAAGRYVDTGILLNGVVDAVKLEIGLAQAVASDPKASMDERHKSTSAIPLLESLLAAIEQEISDGKPQEPVHPHEYENDWKFRKRKP
jgi:hypothetical protein